MSTAVRNFQIAFEFSLLRCLFLRPSPSLHPLQALCFLPCYQCFSFHVVLWNCRNFLNYSYLAFLAYRLSERDFAALLFIDVIDPLLYTHPRIRISPSSLHFFSFWLLLCLLCFCQPTNTCLSSELEGNRLTLVPPYKLMELRKSEKRVRLELGNFFTYVLQDLRDSASIGSTVFIGINNKTQCVM